MAASPQGKGKTQCPWIVQTNLFYRLVTAVSETEAEFYTFAVAPLKTLHSTPVEKGQSKASFTQALTCRSKSSQTSAEIAHLGHQFPEAEGTSPWEASRPVNFTETPSIVENPRPGLELWRIPWQQWTGWMTGPQTENWSCPQQTAGTFDEVGRFNNADKHPLISTNARKSSCWKKASTDYQFYLKLAYSWRNLFSLLRSRMGRTPPFHNRNREEITTIKSWNLLLSGSRTITTCDHRWLKVLKSAVLFMWIQTYIWKHNGMGGWRLWKC